MAEQDVVYDPAISSKLATAKQYKDTADQSFKNGDTKAALSSYHYALMYLQGLDKNAMKAMQGDSQSGSSSKENDPTKERTEADDIIEKIYANQCACYLKQSNWTRAIETADKVLKKNETNYKVMFRKGKALGEQGYIEKALKVLEDLKSKSEADAPAAEAEIARLTALDKKREEANNKRLRGFLSKEKKPAAAPSSSTTETTAS